MSDPHIEAEIARLKDKYRDLDVHYQAISTLVRIGTPAVPALIKALKAADESVRSGAALALGQIGYTSAVPALLEALKDTDPFVRYHAASALGMIRDVSAAPALVAALKDRNSFVRSDAASALGKMGDSNTLPRKVLATSRLSAQKRIEILEALRGVRYKGRLTTLQYTFPDTPTLCQKVLAEGDAQASKGAQTVLNWLKGDQHLVRATQPDPASDGQELLRASQGGTTEIQPETLLHPSDAPKEADEQPHKRRTLRERLFGRRK